MKIQISAKIAAVAIALGISGLANATVVDFNVLDSTASYTFINSGYTEGGLTFASASGNMFHWGTTSSFDADKSGSTMSENYVNDPITVSKTGGGSFTLDSIDLADVYNSGSSVGVALSWTDATGAHSETLTTDNKVGLQTFELGLADVTSFSLSGGNWFQMDNITYNATAAVPEAGSLGMMLAGLLVVGGLARRRKA